MTPPEDTVGQVTTPEAAGQSNGTGNTPGAAEAERVPNAVLGGPEPDDVVILPESLGYRLKKALLGPPLK